MLEKSVFTENDIIKNVKEKYGIIIKSIEIEQRGSANIYYVIDEDKNKYVLKEFESTCDEKNILKEVSITKHLKNNNIPVPEYVKTLNQDFYFKYKNRVVILMKYIEGYVKQSNTGNYKQTMESAEILGKLVKSLETYEYMEEENIEKWYNKTKLIQGKNELENFLLDVKDNKKIYLKVKEKIILDITDKINIINNLLIMNFEGMQKVTHKNSNGDFSIMQFIYRNETVYAVLDFAKARAFPIVWEIIRSYSYIDEKCKNAEIDIKNLCDYTQIFTRYVQLNEHDLKFMPYIYLIQLVTSTFGYKEYINNMDLTNLLEFGIWRTNMSKYLYKNLDDICNKLLKISNGEKNAI